MALPMPQVIGKLYDRGAFVAPKDLEHQEDCTGNQKQGAKDGECRRRQAHARRREDAAEDDQGKTAELFREKDRAFASMCDHSEPRFRFDQSTKLPIPPNCSPPPIVRRNCVDTLTNNGEVIFAELNLMRETSATLAGPMPLDPRAAQDNIAA
jgi:hypothetical protein